MGSSQSTIPSAPTAPPAATPTPSPSSEQATKPKPCCVCKEEKTARDDCMLFSKSDDPAQNECKSMVEQYRACMAGYGFKV